MTLRFSFPAVKKVWRPGGRISEKLMRYVRPHFPPGAKLHWEVASITEESEHDGEWVEGYPHKHVETMGWEPGTMTVMLYLVAPEEGGELAIGSENRDDPFELIKIEPGFGVVIDSNTYHGVKPVTKGKRLALVISDGAMRHGRPA